MLIEELSSTAVRVPKPAPGTALKITRYGVVHAVVINSEDYAKIETMLDAYRAHPPIEADLTDVELRAHAATDAPESVQDYDYEGLAAALET